MYIIFFLEEDRVRIEKASTSSSTTTESNKANMFGREYEITEGKDYLLI